MRNFYLPTLLLQLHCLDARGAYIQANNGLRSESKHVPTFSSGAACDKLQGRDVF
jgi:hypothetical protein